MKAIIGFIIGAFLYLFSPNFRRMVRAKLHGPNEQVGAREEVIVVLRPQTEDHP